MILAAIASCGGGGGDDSDLDSTSPIATVTLSPSAVLSGGILTATISFSENVTGITASDLEVHGGSPGAFVTVDARTYTLAITSGGIGEISVDVHVPAGAGRDVAGNANLAAIGYAAIASAPWASSHGSDAYGIWADLTVTGYGESETQRFRLIGPGEFTMGSPVNEPGRWNGNETCHQVSLSTPYWIADSECTQRMYKVVMNTAPSSSSMGLEFPVEMVSHPMVQSFISSLNLMKTNLSARLPTESEWEYAARGGTSTPFAVSPVIIDRVNCYAFRGDPYIPVGLHRNMTVAVRSLPPNPRGLYEMHGNVWEWCADWWQDDSGPTSTVDPIGPATGTIRVVRGGGWVDYGQDCRSGVRGWVVPSHSYDDLGFRLVVPGRPASSG